MKRLLFAAAAMACLMGATGCTGSFNLTRGLHAWHRSFESPWTDETLFAVLALTGIYPVAIVFDAFIFNLIEFWDGGENPVHAPNAKVIEADDGTQISMQKNDDGTLTVTTANGTFSLARGANGVVAKDADGQVLYTSKRVEQRVEVRDANGATQAFDL